MGVGGNGRCIFRGVRAMIGRLLCSLCSMVLDIRRVWVRGLKAVMGDKRWWSAEEETAK